MKVDLHRLGGSEVIMGMIEKYPNKVEIRLGEILKERGLSQGDLHRMTGIRVATINEIANAKKYSMNIVHLVCIMSALRITDVREIFNIEFDEEVKEAWKEEMEHYEKGMTHKQKQEVQENMNKMFT
jgi:transcriptional regulator with XRE-family HTH domain